MARIGGHSVRTNEKTFWEIRFLVIYRIYLLEDGYPVYDTLLAFDEAAAVAQSDDPKIFR